MPDTTASPLPAPPTRAALAERPVTGVEVPLREGEIIVSATDPQGRITYANGYFIELSGYSEAELLGQPHRLLRHPDMPAAAFADLWATVKQGRPWVGLVKNRCKNGDHYWVEANVTPIYDTDGALEGYVSVRRKPSPAQVARAEHTYRELREGRLARAEFENGEVRPPRLDRLLNPLWRLSLGVRLFLLAFFGVGLAGGLLLLQAAGMAPGWLVGLLAAGAAFAGYSAWWLSNDVVGRLARARALFAEIAVEKHDGAVDIARDDEVGAVLIGLKAMQVRLAFSTQRLRREAATATRINQALDRADTALLVADRRLNVAFANRALLAIVERHGERLRTTLPGLRVAGLVGAPLSDCLPDRERWQARLAALAGPEQARIEVDGLVFDLVLSPVFDRGGERIGCVVEWQDRTQAIAVEREVQGVVEAAARGELGHRIGLADKHGHVRQLGEGINRVLDVFERVSGQLQDFLAALAAGDLGARMDDGHAGAFGRMAQDANRTVQALAATVGQIQEAAGQLGEVATELAAGNAELQERTEQQAASLEETAASMEELTATVRQNAENARRARELSDGVRRVARGGGRVAGEAVEAMAEVASASARIEAIIAVIDGIAFQTNILALNAAVEAARAGEQGRGFAVVATEVRALAQRSAASAREIKGLIARSSEAVRGSSSKVDEAGAAIRSLVGEVESMDQLIAEISAASGEQAQGIGTVNQTVNQLDTATQQNAALVEQASASARALELQARQLADSVARFRLP